MNEKHTCGERTWSDTERAFVKNNFEHFLNKTEESIDFGTQPDYKKQFIEDVKNSNFSVCVCAQGNPFYWYFSDLIDAMIFYRQKYLEGQKYHTWNVSLKQVFFPTNI